MNSILYETMLLKIIQFLFFFQIYLQVTGELLDHLTCWDAMRSALPVGTVSGAPKVNTFSFI